MNALSRRNFLFASSGAAAGSFVAIGLAPAEGAENEAFASSGLSTGRLKPLKHTAIPGFLSAEQIAPHHTAHYGGALKAFTSIEEKLEESFKNSTAIDPLAYDTVQRLKSSRGNSVILHELYFDGLTPKNTAPEADLRRAVEQRFGSLEKWAADFQASAKSAAGWAMLVLHPVNGRLYNVVSDEHAMGALWMAVPLIVIDVYEHAFYIDYQNRKADYVQKFLGHIDWAEANRRFQRAIASA